MDLTCIKSSSLAFCLLAGRAVIGGLRKGGLVWSVGLTD